MKDPTVPELRELAEHAARRVSVYRRRVYLGRGEPRELAELERIADGAVARLHRARAGKAASPAVHNPEGTP
jgi:hypothetical protein